MAHVIKTMQDTLPASTIRSAAHLRDAGRAEGAGRQGRAGPEDRRRLLQEGRQGASSARSARQATTSTAAARPTNSIVRILKKKDPAERLQAAARIDHPQAQFLWAIFRDAFHYIAVHLEAIADTARDVDFALRWGFGWDAGPVRDLAGRGLGAGRRVGEGRHRRRQGAVQGAAAEVGLRWAGREGGRRAHAGRLVVGRRRRNSCRARPCRCTRARSSVRRCSENARRPAPTAARRSSRTSRCALWTLESGLGAEVLILSIKTKMHAIGPGVINGLLKAVELAETQYRGLVSGRPTNRFRSAPTCRR